MTNWSDWIIQNKSIPPLELQCKGEKCKHKNDLCRRWCNKKNKQGMTPLMVWIYYVQTSPPKELVTPTSMFSVNPSNNYTVQMTWVEKIKQLPPDYLCPEKDTRPVTTDYSLPSLYFVTTSILPPVSWKDQFNIRDKHGRLFQDVYYEITKQIPQEEYMTDAVEFYKKHKEIRTAESIIFQIKETKKSYDGDIIQFSVEDQDKIIHEHIKLKLIPPKAYDEWQKLSCPSYQNSIPPFIRWVKTHKQLPPRELQFDGWLNYQTMQKKNNILHFWVSEKLPVLPELITNENHLQKNKFEMTPLLYSIVWNGKYEKLLSYPNWRSDMVRHDKNIGNYIQIYKEIHDSVSGLDVPNDFQSLGNGQCVCCLEEDIQVYNCCINQHTDGMCGNCCLQVDKCPLCREHIIK